ncbi:hypothetical protein [Methylosinus sp. LW3]|uniref:hypothetical protein n=1 Tax=Methylosinus sp. LW3 TaxID=107635 RepID=UPI00046560B4|nr:hypothetical protein [Methylosinus sp. LW3]
MPRGIADVVSEHSLTNKGLATMMHIVFAMWQSGYEPEDYKTLLDRQDREMQSRLRRAIAGGLVELNAAIELLDGAEGLVALFAKHSSGTIYSALLNDLQQEKAKREQAAVTIQRAFRSHQVAQRQQSLGVSGVMACTARQIPIAELTAVEKQLVGILQQLHQEANEAVTNAADKKIGERSRAAKAAVRAEKDVETYFKTLEQRVQRRILEKNAVALFPAALPQTKTHQIALFNAAHAEPFNASSFLLAVDSFFSYRTTGVDALACKAYADHWLAMLPKWKMLEDTAKRKAYAKLWCCEAHKAAKLVKIPSAHLDVLFKQTTIPASTILTACEPFWENLHRLKVEKIIGIVSRCQSNGVGVAPLQVFQFMADHWSESELPKFIARNSEFAVWAVKYQTSWPWTFLKKFKFETLSTANDGKQFPNGFHPRFRTYALHHFMTRHTYACFDPKKYKEAPLAERTGFFDEGATLQSVGLLLQNVIGTVDVGSQPGGRRYINLNQERYCFGYSGAHVNQFYRCTEGETTWTREQLLQLCSILDPPAEMAVSIG